MPKSDLKKEMKHLYQPSARQFVVIDVPAMNFLMLDGHGDPNHNPAYQDVVNALYTLAYSIKFALKPQGVDYSVPPLEGLWWMENMEEFSLATKDRWDWTMMIMQPEWVTSDLVEQVRVQAMRKKGLPMLSQIRLETYHEGLSVQIMYIGAYADEGPTIARMHAFIRENGYTPSGKHHEIYLGDPRKTTPEKLKTVIRQPVKRA